MSVINEYQLGNYEERRKVLDAHIEKYVAYELLDKINSYTRDFNTIPLMKKFLIHLMNEEHVSDEMVEKGIELFEEWKNNDLSYLKNIHDYKHILPSLFMLMLDAKLNPNNDELDGISLCLSMRKYNEKIEKFIQIFFPNDEIPTNLYFYPFTHASSF